MKETTHKNNYIFHFRNFSDITHWLKSDPLAFHLLAEFARRTSRTEREINWQGELIHLKPGQFITGRISTSQTLGMTEGKYRGSFKRLLKSKHIKTIKVTKRYTICLYCSDNPFFIYLDNTSPSEKPTGSPTDNQPLTTNDNGNTVNSDTISQVKKEESQTSKKEENTRDFHSKVPTRNSAIETVGEIISRTDKAKGVNYG